MQDIGFQINIISFSWVELHYILVVLEKQIFDLTHLAPLRYAVGRQNTNADVFPFATINACEYLKNLITPVEMKMIRPDCLHTELAAALY